MFFEDILHKLLHPGTLAMLIPITAIVGGFYLAALKIKAKNQKQIGPEERHMLAQTLRDNQEIKERLGNLEAIITSIDKDLLQLNGLETSEEDKKKIKALAEQLRQS